jgi:hypothetical protein
VLYHAYVDDSADRNRERLIVCGAIIGKKNDWGILNGKWKDRLQRDGLEYFKSSHCETLNGQFHKFRQFGIDEGKRRALLVRDDLYAILGNAPITGLGVTLSVPFHRIMRDDPKTFGAIPEVPYRLAFQQVLAECGKAMQVLGRGNVVAFRHDDTDDFHVLHALFKEFKRLNSRYTSILADFVALDDKSHAPVQAADVAAWVTFQRANDYVSNPSPEAIKRLFGARMYKIVNWLDSPSSQLGKRFTEAELPAKAIYAP